MAGEERRVVLDESWLKDAELFVLHPESAGTLVRELDVRDFVMARK